jgi:glycolate oxidase FAD binding subunit
VDLIHPHSKADVVEVLRDATERRLPVLVVGGRRHMDKGNPCEVEAEIWTTMLDRVVSYDPAEMIAVVEGGMRVGELERILADGGQEWPVDAPPDATVGGVIAAAASSPRRLSVGAVRDTVLEVELVTGDGRFLRGGARTVKNVSGYNVHRLAVGSLGTLGVIVQVALKLRPLAPARRTVRAPGSIEVGRTLLGAIPRAAGVLATPGSVELRLEGWPAEVDEQVEAARRAVDALDVSEGGPFPEERPWEDRPVVAEVAVPPSRLADVLEAAGGPWGALVGVGLAWVGLGDANGELGALRAAVRSAGGIAPVVKGPGGLGDDSPTALEIHRRMKGLFDPAGILAPGRAWGGI